MRALALAAAVWCCPVVAHATDVEVRVTNVRGSAGDVRALLFTRGNWLSQDPSFAAKAPAHPGEVTVVVPNVPPGIYGIVGHHDADRDGDVTRNFLGIPREGIGFSRGVRILFSAPKFDDAAIQVSGPRVVVEIQLQFEP